MTSCRVLVTGLFLVATLVMVWVSFLYSGWLAMRPKPEDTSGVSPLSLGLWKACMYGECTSVFGNNWTIVTSLGGWYQVAQGLAVCGVLLTNIGAVLLLFFFITGKPSYIKCMGALLIIGSICYGAATFTFGFGAENKHLIAPDKMRLDYCFYTACISTVTGMITAVLCAVDYRERTSVKAYYMPLN